VALSDAEYDELSGLLRMVTVSRASIGAVMLFALDHAPASVEVIQAPCF